MEGVADDILALFDLLTELGGRQWSALEINDIAPKCALTCQKYHAPIYSVSLPFVLEHQSRVDAREAPIT